MRKLLPVFVAICVVASTVAVVPAAAASNPLPQSDDDVFEASSGDSYSVNAWERGVFPLRVSPSDNAVSVQNPDIQVKGTGVGEKSLGKNQMLVFNPGTQITLTFDADRAVSGELNDESIQVIAARVTGGEGDGIPNTFSDALNLITQENANENASFEYVNNNNGKVELDRDGANTSITYTPDQAGHYVFFAVTSDGNNGVDISSGEMSVQDDITVVGADAVPVQEGSPSQVSATTNNPDPGDTINFDVDVNSQLAGNDVTHVMAVYKQDTFTGSSHKIVVDSSQLDSDFDLQQDSTFRHSIARVDGVATIEDGASINGIELADGTVSRSVGAGAMIDFIAENLSTTAPTTTPEDSTVLNASIDADVSTDGDTTLEIQTKDDWETGTYRYVYLGTIESDKTAVSTATGTIGIGTGGGGGGGGGGGPSAPSDDDDDDDAEEDVGTAEPDDGTTPGEAVSARVTTQLGEDGTATANLANGTSVTEVQISNPGASGNVTVEEVTDLPEGTPEPPNRRVATVDISAPNPPEGSTATVRVSVRASNLPDDVTPNELVISHYINGAWRDLETSVVSGDDTVVVEAQTDSFSPFAVTYQQQTATPEPTTTTAADTTTEPPTTTAVDTTTSATTTDTGTPGFGFAVTLTALAAAALLAVRRKQ